MRELICITCPRGCHLTVDDDLNVTGNFCPRGAVYGKNEVTNPVRMVTSTVKTNSESEPRLAVHTSKPIPKGMIFDIMNEIKKASIKVPVQMGDVVIKNILDLDVDIIASKTILE